MQKYCNKVSRKVRKTAASKLIILFAITSQIIRMKKLRIDPFDNIFISYIRKSLNLKAVMLHPILTTHDCYNDIYDGQNPVSLLHKFFLGVHLGLTL